MIVRDKTRRDIKGMPRSKGFAFVEFGMHDNALVALKNLNNNPNPPFTKEKRPIVEFSVENAYAVEKFKYLIFFFSFSCFGGYLFQ